MGEHDSDNASSGSHTIPTEAIDQGSTVELDRYTIMQRVQQDLGLTDHATVRMPVQKAAEEADEVDEDAKATMQLPAITDSTTQHNADPRLLASLKDTDAGMMTLDCVLEPVPGSGQTTTPFTTRITFEAVIQPGGFIQIPQEFIKSGHARVGLKIRIVADPA